MRTNIVLWWILTVFFAVTCAVYTAWNILADTSVPWYDAIEWVGSTALLCGAVMAAMIAFYVQKVMQAQGGELPEDSLTADIDDGDPEVGEFSPWSWWPLVLASSAALGVIGLAVGDWMIPVAAGILVIALVGWVYEYYRGYFAR